MRPHRCACAAVLVFFLAVCLRALCQSPPEEGETPLATFTGTLKSLDSKTLMLQQPDSHPLEFYVSRKTSFFTGARKVKASEIRIGDAILVEAQVSRNGKLDAVNVRATRQDRSDGSPAPGAGQTHAHPAR